jgi:hypothetical protein
MKLEVHTFDPELITTLMGRKSVPEGDVLDLDQDARLIYIRTFTGRVKHFPQILHFEVELRSEEGPCKVVGWLFEKAGKKSIVKVMVEYKDVRMDAEQMRQLLGCGR